MYDADVSVIEARGVTKSYAGWFGRNARPALRGLDLVVNEGSVFGLIGPNGAGKTTFIKILLGIVNPTAGTLSVLGGDPRDPGVRAHLGYLPENLQLPPASTPLQILASVARMKSVAPREATLLALLDRVGLVNDAKRRVGAFSKGMRQRLGLAAALVGEPRLLVLDEPTDGIDPLGRVDVRRMLLEERARGATIFLNSHLLSETERVCDRAAILSSGRIVREGTLDELRRVGLSYRARFAPGADPEALAACGFAGDGDSYAIEASGPEALNDALDRARRTGALLVSLEQTRVDLEDVLATAVEEAA